MPPFMKRRFVQFPPAALFFKPGGVPLSALEIVPLGLDEYEMLRLVDYEGRTIQEAARSLGVSRATCGRILEAGRKKTAEALSLGKAIRIEGGEVEVRGRRFRCGSCGMVWQTPGVGAEGREPIPGAENRENPADPADMSLREGRGPQGCPACFRPEVIDLGRGWFRERGDPLGGIPGPEGIPGPGPRRGFGQGPGYGSGQGRGPHRGQGHGPHRGQGRGRKPGGGGGP